MSILKDISSTVKNIFSADDDMIFDSEPDFNEEPISAKSVFPFGKKKNDAPQELGKIPLPSFDPTSHGIGASQNNANRRQRSNGRIQVYVPKTFEEAFNIIKDVKNGFTAMVNVEVANPQVSQRIVDLISGAIYALDGDCKKMGDKQYIFSLSTETVGAYDYLPVNGVKNQDQNSQFNFNMGQQPFNFNQQVNGYNPEPFNFNQQNFNPQSQSQPYAQPQQYNQQPMFNPQPPMSQF